MSNSYVLVESKDMYVGNLVFDSYINQNQNNRDKST